MESMTKQKPVVSPMLEPLEGRTFLTAAHGFVYTPHSVVAGRSLGQWAAEWVKWAYKTPASQNALLDTTGANAKVNQPKDAFFLAGTLGNGKVSRKTTVPAGTPLFFPLVNTFWLNVDKPIPGVQEVPDPPFDKNLPNIRKQLDDVAAGFQKLFATVDGNPVFSLASHREKDPGKGFAVSFPKENLFGLPSDALGKKSATIGIYLMVKPLSPGTHTLHFGGRSAFYNPDGTQDVTYKITVAAPAKAASDAPVAFKAALPAGNPFAGASKIASSILDDGPDDAG